MGDQFCRVSYWRDHTAASAEDANRVVVSPMKGGYPEIEFALPAQKYEFERLLRFAGKCVEFGKYQKTREIRDVLGMGP